MKRISTPKEEETIKTVPFVKLNTGDCFCREDPEVEPDTPIFMKTAPISQSAGAKKKSVLVANAVVVSQHPEEEDEKDGYLVVFDTKDSIDVYYLPDAVLHPGEAGNFQPHDGDVHDNDDADEEEDDE